MNELYLSIAGIRIRISGQEHAYCRLEPLNGYLSAPGAPEHEFHVQIVDRLQQPAGARIFEEGASVFYRSGDQIMRYTGEVALDLGSGYMCTIRRGAQCTVEFRRNALHEGITGKLLLNAMDLPHLLTVHDGFILHASFIERGGEAILFTAPSETGKSTQAKIWCDHMGAQLVNGDRAAVRIIDGEVYACGIPFSGSSPVRRNVTLPLKAIVYLSQAPENTIQRLRGVRAFRRVWEGCTVNVWDREDVELATKTVSEVVSRVPVYHLACTPDVRAAALLKQTMEVEK